MTIPKDVDRYLSDKRARKAQARRRRAWRIHLLGAARRSVRNQNFGKRSKIIRMLAHDNGAAVDRDPRKSQINYSIPTVFSIIDEPEETLRGVSAFARMAYTFNTRSIHLDHSRLKTYDLAANAILDVIAVELNMQVRYSRGGIRWQGKYPEDENIRRFIQALGIIKHLDIKHEYPKSDVAKQLQVFDKRVRNYDVIRPEKADVKSKTVAAFAQHIQACLAHARRQLTQAGRAMLCDYAGEILDNALEHSGMLDWTIQGYLDISLPIPICEIAIFNFGKTIGETFQELPTSSYTWKQVAPYLQHHRSRLFFGPRWSERDLLTLIALQSSVSSKNTDEFHTRGNGSIDLIEFFQRIHDECSVENTPIPAKMAIVSGSTYILFDGTYRLSDPGAGGRRVIAFNDKNDLNQPPDPHFVKSLGAAHFPGTVISIRFPLGTPGSQTVTEAKNAEPGN